MEMYDMILHDPSKHNKNHRVRKLLSVLLRQLNEWLTSSLRAETERMNQADTTGAVMCCVVFGEIKVNTKNTYWKLNLMFLMGFEYRKKKKKLSYITPGFGTP